METTVSATLINNLATTIILNFNFQVFLNLLFYSAAATTGVLVTSKIITVGFEEIIKLLRYRLETKYKDKKELAIAVIKIITEGSTTGWNVKPRDIEHIYFIARLLEGVDKIASKHFDQCLSNWSLCAMSQGLNPSVKEDIEFCIRAQNRAQDACDQVLKIVQKWR